MPLLYNITNIYIYIYIFVIIKLKKQKQKTKNPLFYLTTRWQKQIKKKKISVWFNKQTKETEKGKRKKQ